MAGSSIHIIADWCSLLFFYFCILFVDL